MDREARQKDKECIKKVGSLPQKVQWPFARRTMEDQDTGLIYGTWLRSLRPHPPWREMRHADFKRHQERVIDRCLNRGETLLAVHPDGEPKFGWVCYEWRPNGDGSEFVLHYIYVRSCYRQHNIASALLQFAGAALGKRPIIATHWTKALSYQRERWNIVYDPFLAWEE